MAETQRESSTWIIVETAQFRWQLSSGLRISPQKRRNTVHRNVDQRILWIFSHLKEHIWKSIFPRCARDFVLTNTLFTASINSVSGNLSNSLTISGFVLHTIELKLSASGNNAMTPSGRKRCHATKFSSGWKPKIEIPKDFQSIRGGKKRFVCRADTHFAQFDRGN